MRDARARDAPVPDRGVAPEENADLDAVAVIGAETWPSEDAPDIAPLLSATLARGGIVGGICGGTLSLARAGLFEGRKHTSNGAGWIQSKIDDYSGSSFYQDVPHAVRDAHIVSAPGSAPGTFTTNFLEALYPEKAGQVAEMRVEPEVEAYDEADEEEFEEEEQVEEAEHAELLQELEDDPDPAVRAAAEAALARLEKRLDRRFERRT